MSRVGFGEPRVLFELGDDTRLADFEMSIDGRRFLATQFETVAAEQPYVAIVEWPAAAGAGP